MATGPEDPRKPGRNLELDPTIDGNGPEANSPGVPAAEAVIVRAGRAEDHVELAKIDGQRYVIEKEIARGGMGRIMAARDRRLGRPVAIKELLVASGELRARFEREARITAKLQHPAIVSLLEAGTWPGGEPFYVMKLVAGESLDKVIARCSTLEARLGLLPNVIAAVDALAYAHSVRVIHRDLKPANVLVGEFGETVVIDWGLAKDLADTTDAPDVSVGPYRTAQGQTLAGSVMGTPAYMPVEQARGEAVDERADVYAMGAMLYHVLAGAAPYSGKTGEAILDAVIAGPPPPIEAAGVPPDLVTIVTKAMARGAEDRYPTAKKLADDLKKFQTGQLVGAHHYSAWELLRRWARRHRTPVAVAVVALMLLGVLGTVSVRRIVHEQARTEQSRRDAEELMSFMLVDLRDKLRPLGRLDLLDDVAKKAIAYYDQRGETGSDADLRARALARRNLGEVLAGQGHADAALQQYRASLAIAKTLAAKDPTRADWQSDLSNNHDQVGDVLLAQGDTAGALTEYRTSLTIRETLAAADPKTAVRQRNLGSSHANVASVLLAQGNASGALAEYRAALAITQTLATNDPPNATWQRDLWIGHYRVGDVLFAQGDMAGTLAEYRVAMTIAQTLAVKDPTNAERQRDLSVSHERIGDVLFAQGDAAGALVAYRASMAIAMMLASNDPMNGERQRDVWINHNKIGDVLFAQGNMVGALAEYRALIPISKTLAANDPTNAERQRDVSIGHDKVGDVLLAQGDPAGSLVEFRTSLAIARTLAEKDSTNAERQRDLSVSHDKVGDALLAQEDANGALAEYQASLAIRETLAVSDPTNAERQRDLSIGHDKIGDVLLAEKDAAGALAEYRASLAIASALAANAPTNAIWQQDLAASHENVGDALVAQRETTGAVAEYDAGLAIARRLQAADPTNADVRDLVTTLSSKVATCCGPSRANRSR
jgi:tetratricopeptide (TPR) repeat protein